MATAVENLNKHLRLAVRQLKLISGTVTEIPDFAFEIVDEIYGLHGDKGRWVDTKREDRLCQVCHSCEDVEDEQHF